MIPSSPVIRLPQLFALFLLLGFFGTVARAQADDASQNQLKQLSLEQLGSLEVTTVSKTPEQVWKTPAAIYVITQEDIQRSGATTIPEALRLAPGVEVARIDRPTNGPLEFADLAAAFLARFWC